MFNAHHAENQEMGAVERNTLTTQALAKAREAVKRDEEAILEAMLHSTGFSAAALQKMKENASTMHDMEKRLAAIEGRVPRTY